MKTPDPASEVLAHLRTRAAAPLIVCGDAAVVLAALPASRFDVVLTSPPYWGLRRYRGGGIGTERDPADFVATLVGILGEAARVLKPTGSLWLNLGDTYRKKGLVGIPWRVALKLIDEAGLVLRNDVIWNKVKGGPDQARDKLRNLHEHVFHFVKVGSGYYYDVDAIRTPPRAARVENGAVVSATGVRGVRYRRQLELATTLSESERSAALAALEGALDDVRAGRSADFRMIIRGHQRPTHSDSEVVSGRARELLTRGFYLLRYHPGGSKPADVWDIMPEDTHRRGRHFAAFPAALCRIPILATCPPGGVVLDPFCGTGTTLAVAHSLERRAVGIELAEEYAAMARARLHTATARLPKR